MKVRKLIIVDGTLVGMVGHHFEYAKSVADAARSRGIDVTVACGLHVEPGVRESLSAVPVFRSGVYDECIHSHRFPRLAAWISATVSVLRFFRDWRRSGLDRRCDTNTMVFVPTATEVSVFGLILWLRLRSARTRPRTNLLFRYDPREELVGAVAYLLRPLGVEGSLHLTTDSDVLATDFSSRLRLPVDVLPIPHVYPALLDAHHVHESGAPVRFAFLGNARLEKGIDLLAMAIGELESEIRNGSIVFDIQCNVYLAVEDALAAVRKLDELQGRFGEAIRLMKKPLSTEEYHGLLTRSDAVVIPYRKENYRARTSGILIEAIAAGKPVIVPRDTWMAGQVNDGMGAVVFESGDAKDLARALRNVTANYDRMSQEALSIRGSFSDRHNPDALCRQILDHWDVQEAHQHTRI